MGSRYVGRVLRHQKTLLRLRSNDLNRLIAMIIRTLESDRRALGLVRDNQQQRTINRIRYAALVD